MKYLTPIIPIILLLSSCISLQKIDDNFYYGLKDSEKNLIEKFSPELDLKDGHIYEITGPELLEDLSKNETSLILVMGCDTDLPFNEIREYCNEEGISFYYIITGYYQLDKVLKHDIQFPLYAIDADHYGNKSKTYIRKFEEDIGYYDYFEKNNFDQKGKYIFYSGDSIIEIKDIK